MADISTITLPDNTTYNIKDSTARTTANNAIPKPSSPANGSFLVWNGTAWVAQTLSQWQGGNY